MKTKEMAWMRMRRIKLGIGRRQYLKFLLQ